MSEKEKPEDINFRDGLKDESEIAEFSSRAKQMDREREVKNKGILELDKMDTTRRGFLRGAAGLGIGALAAGAGIKLTSENVGTKAQEATSIEAGTQVDVDNAADGMFQIMKAFDVDTIFFTTDDQNRSFAEAITKDRRFDDDPIKGILCLHEQSAVAAANGYAKAHGMQKPGIVSTGGASGKLAVGNMQSVYADKVPMIHIGAAYSIQMPLRSGQSMSNISKIMDPHVKWQWEFVEPANINPMLSNAFQIAMEDPKGPAFIGTYMSVLEQDIGSITIPDVDRYTPSEPQVPSDSQLKEVAQELIEADNPVITAGWLGRQEEAVDELCKLAERLAIPVVETDDWMNFPSSHPLHMGFSIGNLPEEPDVILCLDDHAPGEWGQPEDATVIVIDKDPIQAWEHYYTQWSSITPADLRLEADGYHTLVKLNEVVRQEMDWTWAQWLEIHERRQEIEEAHNDLRDEWQDEIDDYLGEEPITPQQMMYEMNDVKDDDDIVVPNNTLTGWIRGDYRMCMDFDEPGTIILPTSKMGLLGMGAFGAVGVKAAKPDRNVICFMGDGEARFGCQEAAFFTAERFDLPILWVFDNNGCLTTTKRGQQEEIQNHAYETGDYWTHHLYPPNVSFAKVAEAYDIWNEVVEDPNDLQSTYEDAHDVVANGDSAVVDVMTKPHGIFDHEWDPDREWYWEP